MGCTNVRLFDLKGRRNGGLLYGVVISGAGRIRVYTSVDSRFILEDLIAKLKLLYGA